MKKYLVGIFAIALAASPALAADMPVKAPPAQIVTAYGWTGCYIGANAGAAFTRWGRDGYFNWNIADADGRSGSDAYRETSFTYGATIGCNYQFNTNWVVGAEADWNGLSGAQTARFTGQFGGQEPSQFAQFESTWFATIRARLGYSVGRLLVYGTGGLARGDVRYVIGRSDDPDPDYPSSAIRWGWTAGAGLEYMLAPNWSAKAEYIHVDLGSAHLNPIGWNTDYRFDVNASTRHHIVRIGLNYHWGGARFSGN